MISDDGLVLGKILACFRAAFRSLASDDDDAELSTDQVCVGGWGVKTHFVWRVSSHHDAQLSRDQVWHSSVGRGALQCGACEWIQCAAGCTPVWGG